MNPVTRVVVQGVGDVTATAEITSRSGETYRFSSEFIRDHAEAEQIATILLSMKAAVDVASEAGVA